MTILSLAPLLLSLSATAAAMPQPRGALNLEQAAEEVGRFCGIALPINTKLLSIGFFRAYEDVQESEMGSALFRTVGIVRMKPGRVLQKNLHPTLVIQSSVGTEFHSFETDFCGVARLAADPAVRSLESGTPGPGAR